MSSGSLPQISPRPKIQPLGDAAVILEWPSLAADEAFDVIQQAMQALTAQPLVGQTELVPGFDSLTIHFAAEAAGEASSPALIEERLQQPLISATIATRLIQIPVCYDPEFALDLADIARLHAMTAEEVVRLHSTAEYRVQMIGFTPGFPYLAGLPTALATPRRREPRLEVPQGSIAIGGLQTGIYPSASPGGWNIIGRTPVALFVPCQTPPTLLQPGDRVRFTPISRAQFAAWEG